MLAFTDKHIPCQDLYFTLPETQLGSHIFVPLVPHDLRSEVVREFKVKVRVRKESNIFRDRRLLWTGQLPHFPFSVRLKVAATCQYPPEVYQAYV